MHLSSFELVKKGVSTIIDVVDAFAREQINQLNSSLNAKQNKTDNALTTTAKTIVGAINEINSDLTPTYFQLTSSGETVNIEQQDNWRQGNRIHIGFSASASGPMPRDYVWAIIPVEYRPASTKNNGYVYIENIANTYINSVRVESNGYIHQTYSSSVPANTRVTFIADYFI